MKQSLEWLKSHLLNLENELLLGETRRSAQRIGELLSPDFFDFAVQVLPIITAPAIRFSPSLHESALLSKTFVSSRLLTAAYSPRTFASSTTKQTAQAAAAFAAPSGRKLTAHGKLSFIRARLVRKPNRLPLNYIVLIKGTAFSTLRKRKSCPFMCLR